MTSARKGPLIGLWLVLLPVLGSLYLMVPVSPDQALFDYIAWSRVQGSLYYADIAEQNWPGEILLHELGIRLFGVHFWTYRLIDFVLLIGSTGAGALLLHHAGARIAPWVMLFLYPSLYVTSGAWTAGQRDIVAAGFLISAAALVQSGWRPGVDARSGAGRPLPLRYLLAGAVVGFAILTRPTYLTYLLGLILLEWLHFPNERELVGAPVRRTLLLLAGFALPIAVVAVLGATTESLDDFYEQAILFNLEAYPTGGDRSRLIEPLVELLFHSWHWITVLATVGLVLWAWTSGLARAQVLILGLIATILVSYVAQNKGFGYHLSGLLLALSLLVAVLIEQLAALRRDAMARPCRRGLGLVLLAVLALVVAGTSKKLTSFMPLARALAEGRFEPHYAGGGILTWPEMKEMVRLVQAGSAPAEPFLQWGRHFEVGFLAQRPSSIRFVSTPALDLLSEKFSASEAWLAEVEHDLREKRPTFMLIERRVLPSYAPYDRPRPEALRAEQMIVESLEAYDPAFETPTAILFRLR